MKLIAIKKECYAIADVSSTSELRAKYKTLCSKQDFRTRKSWQHVLQILREDGDWIGVTVADIQNQKGRRKKSPHFLPAMVFTVEGVENDAAANNDD